MSTLPTLCITGKLERQKHTFEPLQFFRPMNTICNVVKHTTKTKGIEFRIFCRREGADACTCTEVCHLDSEIHPLEGLTIWEIENNLQVPES